MCHAYADLDDVGVAQHLADLLCEAEVRQRKQQAYRLCTEHGHQWQQYGTRVVSQLRVSEVRPGKAGVAGQRQQSTVVNQELCCATVPLRTPAPLED